MPTLRMTAATVEKLKSPATGRTDYHDADVPGLVLRVSHSGAMSWSFTYRFRGQQRRLSLGGYPGLSLKVARERARDARGAVQRGEDPVEDRKAEERERAVTAFDACAKDFIEKYAKKHQRCWTETERLLERFAIPAWGSKPVREIRRRDVVDLLDKIAAKTPYQANQVRAHLSRLFNWLVEREALEINPVIGVAPRIKPEARSRILADAELAALWRASVSLGGVFSAAVRFLMVTGVRREEGARLRWDEVKDKEWAAMPASRMKGKRDFKAPLSTLAQAIIEAQSPIGSCPYVFTTNGRSPISGWSQFKAKADAVMAKELKGKVPNWRFHDLRRTLASGLAQLGYRAEVIKRVLGHAANSNDVTAHHYVWHGFDAEAQAAVQAWADHLAKLVTPTVAVPASEAATAAE